MVKPKLILFEVYETLLDVSEIKQKLNDLCRNKIADKLWLELFMQYMFVSNCTNTFYDFIALAKDTMNMTAATVGAKIEAEDLDMLIEKLKYSPLHEDVQPALSNLLDKGILLGALTNVPDSIVGERMQRTGFISFFSKVLCAEQIGKYKPDTTVYQWALKEFQASPEDTWLVTSFGWDIIGGSSAGMKTVFLNEKEEPPYSFSAKADLICKNVQSLVELITGQPNDEA